MDQYLKTPFNIDLLVLSPAVAKQLKEVTKLNIFEASTQNFEPDGLFSTTIFGPPGSEARNNTFGYIDLKVKILHPLIYQHITTLKAFYKDIITGKKYAVFNEKEKDFIISTMDEGETGYTFFMKHISKLKLSDNDSDQREFKIKMIELYAKPETRLDKWLVLPAGMRDYVVDDAGKPTEDEVNDLYRKLLATVNIIGNTKITPATEASIDSIKVKIQTIVVEIYEHFRTLLDGKHKFIQGKWAKRAIKDGTRNVITSAQLNISDLSSGDNITLDHSVVGLYQYIRAISSITANRVHTVFINKIFNPETTISNLVNPKTMKTELIDVPIKKRDEWLSLEGLDDIIGKLEQNELRSEPVMVNGNYLLLLHDTGKEITVVFNTDNLTDEYDPKYLRPITYYELMYLAIYDVRDHFPCYVTRYPVANLGGVYPSKLYVKTTEKGRDIHVTINGVRKRVIEYPNFKEKYFNSLSPHPTHIEALGADYDGDTMSMIVLQSEDSVKEVNELLDSKEFYLKPNGDLAYNPVSDTLEYVIKSMTDTNEKTAVYK